MAKYYNNMSSVSRDLTPKDKSFDGVVYQSGKPILDSELNLDQDVRSFAEQLLRHAHQPSGFLRGQTIQDPREDFFFPAMGDPLLEANTFYMRKLHAIVAGRPVVVEYANTDTEGWNKIILEEAPIKGGTPPDVKRTDFVFLEVWFSQLAPSPAAEIMIEVVDDGGGNSTLTDGDLIQLYDHNGALYTVVAKDPGMAVNPNDFEIGNVNTTALQMAAAINNLTGAFIADTPGNSNFVRVRYQLNGTDGNLAYVEWATVNGAAISVANGSPSPVNFSGGADRSYKPSQDHLYVHGNVQSPSGVWLDDDLRDDALGVESAQRIQLQYRIRVTGAAEAVNHKMECDGFSNANVHAWGNTMGAGSQYPFVPADGTTVVNNSSAVAYERIDSGLYISGDGSQTSANNLQTVDGFVYAIPIGFIFRRNNAFIGANGVPGDGEGFHPKTNTNGACPMDHITFTGNSMIGQIDANLSDRPDGAFCDKIEDWDLLDLRKHSLPTGTDVQAELRRQMQSLMDGNFKTWAIDSTSKHTLGGGSGDVSVQNLVCNELGRDSSHGGNDSTSGVTQHGTLIRNFDHVARRFADQHICERFVIPFVPTDVYADNPGRYVDNMIATSTKWYEGDVLHIDFENLNATTLADFDPTYSETYFGPNGNDANIYDFMPPGTVITDVVRILHDDGHTTAPIDQKVQIALIQGLGTRHVELTLDANTQLANGGDNNNGDYQIVGDANIGNVGSSRRIFVEIEVTYPLSHGLTDTPDREVQPEVAPTTSYPYGPLVENDVTQRPAEMYKLTEPAFREGFREVMVEQVSGINSSGQWYPVTDQIVSADARHLYFPRRVWAFKGLEPTVTEVSTGTAKTLKNVPLATSPEVTEIGSSSRQVVLQNNDPLSEAQCLCDIAYFAQDAIANHGLNGGGYQISIYYRTNAPQTCGSKENDVHDASGAGVVPTNLSLEPLAISNEIWSGQVGMGSLEVGYPYVAPLDQIPSTQMKEISGTPVDTFYGEWQLCASTNISIDDFDVNTGLLALHPFVQADATGTLQFGDATRPPRTDVELRTFYPFASPETYRPTVMSQNMSGVVRHKVMFPILARTLQDSKMFRKGELVLVVLTRWAQIDDDNTIRFVDENNSTCAAVYRTKGMLLTVDGI